MVKNLIVLDLDGTLAPSKSSIDPEMSTLLRDLLGIVKVAVISGGDWPQFEKQVLSHLPHDTSLVNRYALLLIFQGMDAAGKDGAIRHVMSGINPQGCEVFSFKQPSAEELEHDFLWRATCRLPERGHIGIFNRSYYEEVLVVRVHPESHQH